MSIQRKQGLGYEVVSLSNAKKVSAHPTGDSKVRVGDVILMQVPEEEHAAISAARRERRERRVAKNPAEEQRREAMKQLGMETL